MYFGLAHFLNFDTHLIDRIRQKYDPTVDLIAPHITVLFPIHDTIKKSVLATHINKILKNWPPFQIHICGLCKSWDHWLLLGIEEGNAEVKDLYHEIYSGPLVTYKRDDIDFIPHISLGLFAKQSSSYDYTNPKELIFDKHSYDNALREAESLNLNYNSVFDKLNLVILSDDFSKIDKGENFFLNEKY